MESKLTILGCGSAAPSLLRASTAQVLEMAGKVILIDCGEGTQWQLLKCKISVFKIDIIFISHFHGDHYLGLPGLLNTLALYGRKKPLKIFGPQGIRQLLKQSTEHEEMTPHFEVEIIELNNKVTSTILTEQNLTVSSIPLEHRIPCYGYHFEFNHFTLKIDKQKCDSASLGVNAIKAFKKGEDYSFKNQFYLAANYTIPIHTIHSYTFITDTLFLPSIAESFRHTNLLYHESTYLNILLDKAQTTFHSTALQAAEMAKLAEAKTLVIGHFSSRYNETNELLEEARSLFTNTELASDGRQFIIK